MTPCPSAVEYVTPVFAKNYQVCTYVRINVKQINSFNFLMKDLISLSTKLYSLALKGEVN